jgi:hypothetical protein
VSNSGGGEICSSPIDHLCRQVDSEYASTFACQPAGDKEVEAGPAPEIEDDGTLRDVAELKGVAYAAKGFEKLRGSPTDDVAVVSEGLRALPAGRIAELPGSRCRYLRILFPDRPSDRLDKILRVFFTPLGRECVAGARPGAS